MFGTSVDRAALQGIPVSARTADGTGLADPTLEQEWNRRLTGHLNTVQKPFRLSSEMTALLMDNEMQ